MLSSAAQTVMVSKISSRVLRTMNTALPRDHRDQPLLGEPGDGLAHRGARNPELPGERALVEPQIGRLVIDPRIEDRLAQLGVDAVGKAALPHRLKRHRVGKGARVGHVCGIPHTRCQAQGVGASLDMALPRLLGMRSLSWPPPPSPHPEERNEGRPSPLGVPRYAACAPTRDEASIRRWRARLLGMRSLSWPPPPSPHPFMRLSVSRGGSGFQVMSGFSCFGLRLRV